MRRWRRGGTGGGRARNREMEGYPAAVGPCNTRQDFGRASIHAAGTQRASTPRPENAPSGLSSIPGKATSVINPPHPVNAPSPMRRKPSPSATGTSPVQAWNAWVRARHW